MADPTHTDLKLRCANGHRWEEKWSLPMTLTAMARRVKAVSKCPQCEADVFLGWPNEKPAEAPHA